MRSDLDTARGIFWWAVVPLVLLVVSCVARAQTVVTCSNAALVGTVAPSCSGGSVVEVHSSDLGINMLVAWCAVPAGDGSDCSYAQWVPAGALSNLDTVYVSDYESFAVAGPLEDYPTLGLVAEKYGFLDGVGGGGGDEWTLEDLDLSEAASAFAAAFMVCWMFWGLGKGVGLLVGFLRRV